MKKVRKGRKKKKEKKTKSKLLPIPYLASWSVIILSFFPILIRAFCELKRRNDLDKRERKVIPLY